MVHNCRAEISPRPVSQDVHLCTTFYLYRLNYVAHTLQILKKIGKTLVRINVTDQSAEDAYNELVSSSPRLFGMLSSIYRLNEEEQNFAWSAGIA